MVEGLQWGWGAPGGGAGGRRYGRGRHGHCAGLCLGCKHSRGPATVTRSCCVATNNQHSTGGQELVGGHWDLGGALGAWGNGASPLPQHHGLLCTAAVHWKEGGRVVSPHSRALRGWELEGGEGAGVVLTPPPAVQWGQMGVVGWSRLLAAVWGGTEDSDPPLPSPAPLTGLHLLHSL